MLRASGLYSSRYVRKHTRAVTGVGASFFVPSPAACRSSQWTSARHSTHDSALLPFDAVPNVRVHDGNLIRVVLHAMSTHLRALRVQYQWPGVKVLPHRPSVYSLTRHLAPGAVIAYPPKDPSCVPPSRRTVVEFQAAGW